MYEFWFDYVKPKYGQKAKLCFMNTNRFIVYIKTEHIYSDIAKDVETRFDTSIHKLDRPIGLYGSIGLIGLMKNELGEKIREEFVGLRTKTYSYFTYNNNEDKKVKGTKSCVIKRKLKLENHKNCLKVTQFENKISYLDKNEIKINSLWKNKKIHKKQ